MMQVSLVIAWAKERNFANDPVKVLNFLLQEEGIEQ